MAWEPDRRYNFFFSPPAHLCAVTCMTEISFGCDVEQPIQSINSINQGCLLQIWQNNINILFGVADVAAVYKKVDRVV